jgi:hypothetical protein
MATAPAIAAAIPGQVSGSPLFDLEFIPRDFSPWGIDANDIRGILG